MFCYFIHQVFALFLMTFSREKIKQIIQVIYFILVESETLEYHFIFTIYSLSMIDSLPLVEAFMTECLRYGSFIVMNVQRAASRDTTVGGYHVPKVRRVTRKGGKEGYSRILLQYCYRFCSEMKCLRTLHLQSKRFNIFFKKFPSLLLKQTVILSKSMFLLHL